MPSANLPIEYQEVEYLESTGVQWIDTGITPSDGFGFYIDCMPLVNISTTSASAKILGSTKFNGGYWGGFIITTYESYAGGQSSWFRNDEIAGIYDPGLRSYERVQLENKNNHYTSSTGKSYDTQKYTKNYVYGSLWLFAAHVDRTVSNAGTRIYEYRAYDGDSVAQSLIPCYRKSDHVAGMYDTVSDTFLTNQGTGEFLVGPDVILLPPGYRQVEWLESSGTQWLDTGYVPTVDTWAECEYMFTKVFSGDKMVFGLTTYGRATSFYFELYNSTSWYAACGLSKYRGVLLKSSSIIPHKVTLTQSSITLDSSNANPNRTQTFNNSLSCYAFAWNSNGVAQCMHDALRLYSLTFFENDTPMVELVPCYRISDEKPGMYDTVRNVFLTNQGTGEFMTSRAIYPSHERVTAALEMAWRRRALASKANRVLPPEYQRVKWLSNEGNSFIATDYVLSNATDMRVALSASNNNTEYARLLGWASSSVQESSRFVVTCGANNAFPRMQYTSDSVIRIDNGVNKRDIFVDFQISTTTVVMDGIEHTLHDVALPTLGLVLFNSVQEGTAATSGKGKIKAVTIYENNELVRNLIPCYRKQDNKPGMYDTVSKQFLTNQGAGVDFVLGPDV